MNTNETPWKDISTDVSELKTSEEAIQSGNLDWEVKIVPLNAELEYDVNGTPCKMIVRVPGKFLSVRQDNKAILGVVGNQYSPVQNRRGFALVDDIMALENGAKFEAVGSIFEGKRVWMLAKLPGEIKAKGTEDVMLKYLICSNSHDGTKALSIGFMCFNPGRNTTYSMSFGKVYDKIDIRHTSSSESRIQEAIRVTKIGNTYFDNVQSYLDKLADIVISRDKMKELVETLFPVKLDAIRAGKTIATREKVIDLFDGSTVLRGTGYAAYNAICEFADHFRSFRSSKNGDSTKEENRFISVIEGGSYNLKNEALKLILEG